VRFERLVEIEAVLNGVPVLSQPTAH